MTDPSPPALRPSVLIDPARSSGPDQRPNLVILTLPQKLERIEKPVTLQGEIIRAEPDGTLRILTSEGEITAKPDRPITAQNGARVEIRLPKGEPPATATLRPAPLELPATPEYPQTPPTQLPPKIQMRDLPQLEKLVLKSLPPQQLTKVIAPYIEQIKVQMTIPFITPPAITTETPDPLQPLKSITEAESFKPFAPLTISKPTLIFQPETISDSLQTQNILLPPIKNLLVFLKQDNPEGLTQTNLNILPLQILLKAVMASLIAKPLEIPLNIPKADILIPRVIPLAPLTLLNAVADIPTPPQDLQIPPPQIPIPPDTVTPVPSQPIPSLIEPALLSVPALSGPIEIISVQVPAPVLKPVATKIEAPTTTSTSTPPLSFLAPDPQAARIDTLRAVVVGFTPEQNFPILRFLAAPQSSSRLYALPLPIDDIPLGTQIEIRPQIAAPPLSPALNTATPVLSPLFLLSPQGWITLTDIHSALTQISPAVAQSFNAILPQANNPQQLGPAALFFLAALRSGDLTSWLGDKVIETLKRAGKEELITRLGREVSTLARQSSEPISQDWRMASIPLSWNNDIQKIIVHYKKDDSNPDSENKKNGSSTRFLMNLNLSSIGALQLDGLFQVAHKRLDLIVRTKAPFSAPMQGEMRKLYGDALGQTQYTGDLAFQHKPEQWVHVTPDKQAAFSEKI